MEQDKFPTIELFPKLTRIGRVVGSLLRFLPDTPLANHGDHLPHTEASEQPEDVI